MFCLMWFQALHPSLLLLSGFVVNIKAIGKNWSVCWWSVCTQRQRHSERQTVTRLRGQRRRNQRRERKKIKEAEEAQGVPAWANLGSFPVLSGILLMAPPNEKPNTLHSAFIRGVHFGMGSFWVWHMAPQKTKARWRMPALFSTPATPAASRPRRALVIAFY